MKIFHCDHCGHLLSFENTQCVCCGRSVAYLPDLRLVGSLESDGGDTWRSPLPRASEAGYRLCQNYSRESICNWAVPAHEDNPLCVSCRTTRVIPNLSDPEHRSIWYRLEVAKRRLLFTLIQLGLPMPAYAASHPWEDWAETWAQYLHMVDTLETAAACGLSLTPRRRDEPTAPTIPEPLSPQRAAFQDLIDSWFPLTYVLNNLNRGLGRADAYPFVLSPSAIAKLKFVDDLVRRAQAGGPGKVGNAREEAATTQPSDATPP